MNSIMDEIYKVFPEWQNNGESDMSTIYRARAACSQYTNLPMSMMIGKDVQKSRLGKMLRTYWWNEIMVIPNEDRIQVDEFVDQAKKARLSPQ